MLDHDSMDIKESILLLPTNITSEDRTLQPIHTYQQPVPCAEAHVDVRALPARGVPISI